MDHNYFAEQTDSVATEKKGRNRKKAAALAFCCIALGGVMGYGSLVLSDPGTGRKG